LRILLGLLILVEIIFGVLYTMNTARWEAPDEPAQFNYVRHVAETGTLPVLKVGDYDQAYLEKIKAEKFPPTLSIDAIRYESYQPPLYYFVAAPVYLIARAVGFDVVIALRLFSVVLGAILLMLAYRVFVQVFPKNLLLAATGIGFMATVPMHIAMSASINADTFAEVVLAALLLIALARASGTLSDERFVLLGGILYGLALLTSIKIYPSGLLLILAELAFRGWGSKAGDLKSKILNWQAVVSGARILLFLLALSLVLSFWWFARNALVYGGGDIFGLARHDVVVTGQPTTVEWVAMYGLKNVLADFFIITFKSFWAQFGWMGVLVNDRIYVGLFLLSAVAFVGALLWIFRIGRERGKQIGGKWMMWGILGAWMLVVTVDHAFYNLRYFQPQGRYLFPALIPFAAFAVAGLYELLDKRHAWLILSLLYITMLGLDYISLFWFIVPQLRT
jgi:hypothetical protein